MTGRVESVLQVNVRLAEGGAAGVARTLADELRRQGIRSPFVYGYGNRGGRSPMEEQYDALKLTPAPIALLNRESHLTFGKETPLHSLSAWSQLRDRIAHSDVVHLHAIHSFMAHPDQFLQLVMDQNKPVVWTLHDQWVMTGRCAQPGSCRGWETGCDPCPDLQAYPPARVDRAAKHWPQRRELIARLQATVPTAIVACADWLAEEAEIAGFQNISVIKNSVDREFWDAATELSPIRPASAVIRNVFVCRDLRDARKVDWGLLRELSQVPGNELTIIGDDPPHRLDNVHYVPAIGSRAELAEALRGHDRLIFTSQIDYFPLTLAEALTCGLEVLAVESRAAREFSSHTQVRLFSSALELLTAAITASEAVPPQDRDFFSPGRMAADYMAVYRALIPRSIHGVGESDAA